LQEQAKAQSQNLLREGRFRLAPNHKDVYYAVRMADGSEQPLLKNPQEILFFPLQTGLLQTSLLDPRSSASPPVPEETTPIQPATPGEPYP
jgi:hypothetical protein